MSNSKPVRMKVAFDHAQEHLPELADIVVNHRVELLLTREGQQDVALLSAVRLAHYKAIEASLAGSAQTTTPPPACDDQANVPSATRQEFLEVSATYSVVSTNVSPRQLLEQYHIECEVPITGRFDMSIAVGDDQSAETYLATWRGFQWPQQWGLSQVVLRSFCLAKFGSTELPFEREYSELFSSVVLEVRQRAFSVIEAPLLLLSASIDSTEVAVKWSRFGEKEAHPRIVSRSHGGAVSRW